MNVKPSGSMVPSAKLGAFNTLIDLKRLANLSKPKELVASYIRVNKTSAKCKSVVSAFGP